jgi:outer membrane protein
LSLGLGIADVDPGYAGYHHRIDPLPLISYRSDRFVLAGTSASVIVSQANAYTLSLGLVPQLDRVSANDSLQLAGIQTREWTIDGAVTLSTRQPWGRASFAVLHDILDRNNGTEVRLNYSYPIPLGTGTLAPGVGLTWESENLADYYYGVSTAESLPDRPAYSPGSALNPNVRLDYTVALSRKWLFGAEANYVNFARSIRNSPIIDHKGSSAIMVFFVRSFSPGATTSAHTLVMPIEH